MQKNSTTMQPGTGWNFKNTYTIKLYPVACRVKEYMERSISTLPSPFFCFLSAAFTNIYRHTFCAMYALESLEYIIFTGI